MSVNASLGMVAVFCCSSTLGDPGAQWRVNGTFVNRLPENTTDVFTNITVTTNDSLNCLYIQASEERNNTVVECVIKDQQGNHEYINATLTVQGWFQLHYCSMSETLSVVNDCNYIAATIFHKKCIDCNYNFMAHTNSSNKLAVIFLFCTM